MSTVAVLDPSRRLSGARRSSGGDAEALVVLAQKGDSSFADVEATM